MSSIVWLTQKNSMHTYGLEILSTDKYTVENFVYNQVVTICQKLNCNYFIQGFQVRDFPNSWAFVEFFGEGSEDTMIKVMEEFNKLYGKSYYGNEIMMEKPTKELLKDLKLM